MDTDDLNLNFSGNFDHCLTSYSMHAYCLILVNW